MHNGWIKLHRKIRNSDMYKSFTSKQRDVMTQLLLMANHKPNEWEYNGEIHTCKAGQFKTSYSSILDRCAKDVSIKNVRTAINKMEVWEFLAKESAKSGMIITILNWETYQDKENENGKGVGKEAAKEGQRKGKEAATNKNDKELKTVKNERKDIFKDRKYTVEYFISRYKEIASFCQFPIPRNLSVSRKKKITTRIKNNNDSEIDRFFISLSESSYLSSMSWFDFDFIVRSDENFEKIADKKYKWMDKKEEKKPMTPQELSDLQIRNRQEAMRKAAMGGK